MQGFLKLFAGIESPGPELVIAHIATLTDQVIEVGEGFSCSSAGFQNLGLLLLELSR